MQSQEFYRSCIGEEGQQKQENFLLKISLKCSIIRAILHTGGSYDTENIEYYIQK